MKIESGLYNFAGEVAREALRLRANLVKISIEAELTL
jgi:hypothetical protein